MKKQLPELFTMILTLSLVSTISFAQQNSNAMSRKPSSEEKCGAVTGAVKTTRPDEVLIFLRLKTEAVNSTSRRMVTYSKSKDLNGSVFSMINSSYNSGKNICFANDMFNHIEYVKMDIDQPMPIQESLSFQE